MSSPNEPNAMFLRPRLVRGLAEREVGTLRDEPTAVPRAEAQGTAGARPRLTFTCRGS